MKQSRNLLLHESSTQKTNFKSYKSEFRVVCSLSQAHDILNLFIKPIYHLLFWKLKIWMPHFYLSSLLNNNFRSEQAGFPWKNNTYGSFTLNTLMILSLNRWHSLRDRESCIIIVLVNPHATTLNADKNHNGTYMSFLLSILWNYYYIVLFIYP